MSASMFLMMFLMTKEELDAYNKAVRWWKCPKCELIRQMIETGTPECGKCGTVMKRMKK